GLKRPTRRQRTGRPFSPATCATGLLPPYLVLLRAGFCLPPVLPRARCALTAPFHPYLSCPRRYFFCATIRQIALPGRYPAHCPPEFGLSSGPRPSGVQRDRPEGPVTVYPGAKAGDRLADCDAHDYLAPAPFPRGLT